MDENIHTSNILGINLFQYCGNNPINYSDPTGEWFGVDDAVTGPVDEIIVLGMLAILAACGVTWAEDAMAGIQSGLNAIWADITNPSVEKKEAEKEKKTYPLPSSAVFFEAVLPGEGIFVLWNHPLTAAEAAKIVSLGCDVYTYEKSDALALCLYVSGGFVGPEKGAKEGNCWHYHLKKRRGGAHIFYGGEGVVYIGPC